MDPRFATPSGGPLSRVTSGAGHAEDTAKDTANTRGDTERGCQGRGWGGHQSGVGESWGPAGWLTELLWWWTLRSHHLVPRRPPSPPLLSSRWLPLTTNTPQVGHLARPCSCQLSANQTCSFERATLMMDIRVLDTPLSASLERGRWAPCRCGWTWAGRTG